MSTDLTALDRRIAEEFMGWTKGKGNSNTVYDYSPDFWADKEKHTGFSIYDFKPTTDMRAAYVVLDKIATKLDVMLEKRTDTSWGAYVDDDDDGHTIGAEYDELPLAISRLAEIIMDDHNYMKLFKEEE